jgi:RNA polymerase sigma factor (sigma-70 family)
MVSPTWFARYLRRLKAAVRMRKESSMKPASNEQSSDSIVLVVDDEAVIRHGIQDLLHSVGLQSKGFGSATELFGSKLADQASCLILDVRLPGLSGFDCQAELAKRHINIPIIFITGHGDIRMSVTAMKAGAVEFLTKPFREQDLLDAVRAALDRDRERRECENSTRNLRCLYNALTEREQEIMVFVIAGLMNKQVAEEIGIAEVTVKVHRHKLMKKLRAKNLAALVRMASILELPHANPELGKWQINNHTRHHNPGRLASEILG